ncbi:glycosyltransferase family 39 protein, partial [Candidatus Binatia bacterium]|nr:glycosyltransferase family 39 protein [Candidatus Binatia bacterium]
MSSSAESGRHATVIAPARLVERHPALAATLAAVLDVLVKHPGIATRSLWLDEAWTVALGLQTPAVILNTATYDQNPPLYLLLMAGWLDLFGTSELALRVPSLLASAASAAVLLLFVRRFFGAEAALTASLLYLVSPAQTTYATEGRTFALVGLLCLASFHAYFSLFERPRRRTALVLAVLNAAALWSHYTIAFAWLAQAVCAPLVGGRRGERRAFGLYLASQTLTLVLFAPLVRYALAAMPEVPTSWLPPPDLATLGRVARDLVGSRSALHAGLLLLAGFAAWRVYRGSRDGADRTAVQDDWRLVVAACWAIVPVVAAFVVSQKSPVLHVRYELYAGLGWIVTIAVVLSRLPWPATARALAALVYLALAIKAPPNEAYRDPAWRQIAALERRAPADVATATVILPDVDCIPFAYYAAPDLLPRLFAPDGSYAVLDFEHLLAQRRIFCGEEAWTAAGEAPDAVRVLLVATDPEALAAERVSGALRERGLVSEPEQRLGNRDVRRFGSEAR